MSKISQLPPLAEESVDGSELAPVTKGGKTFRAPIDYLGRRAAVRAESARDVAVASSVQYESEADAVINLADGAFGSYLDNEGRPVWGQRDGLTMTPIEGPWLGAERVGTAGGGTMQDVADKQQIVLGTTHIDLQAEYGVTPSASQSMAQRAAAIQEAFDTAPLGSTLHFPPGLLVVSGELTMNRQVNLQGHGTILVSVPGGADKSVLKIRLAEAVGQPAPPALNDSRGMRITDMIIHAQGACNNCVDIRHEVGDHPYNIATLQMFIQNNTFSVPNDAAGHGLRIDGLVTQLHVIESNQIVNGIYLFGPADCIRIIYNNFFGQKTAVSGWLAEGAFATLIMGNTMVCRDGALYLTGGSQLYFWHNQIENSEGNGQGVQAFDSSVVVYGLEYRCRSVSIKYNNFGAGEFVRHNIAIAGETTVGGGDFDIRDVIIEENIFNRGAYTWEGSPNVPYDIILSNSLVKNAIVGKNFYRGEGSARGNSAFSVYPGMTPNTLDQDELIQFVDASEGAIGLRQGPARLIKANGYTGNTTFIKTRDNIVWPSAAPLTSATPGANNAGTLVATFPVGYRPPENVYRTAICVQSGVGTFPVLVLITTAGEVILAENAPASDIRLPEFRCVGSASYSSGP